MLRLEAVTLSSGERVAYGDIEIITCDDTGI